MRRNYHNSHFIFIIGGELTLTLRTTRSTVGSSHKAQSRVELIFPLPARVKNHDQRTSIWRFYNISTKRPQTTPICAQTPPGCYIMHKKITPGAKVTQKNKKPRGVLCIEAKSATKKFDVADTAQNENSIRFSAIYHVDTPVCSMHTVE